MQIIKQVMDLYSNQVVRGIKSFLNKINIQTSNSARTYYLEAGADTEYPINADPGGGFRAAEFELRFKSFIPILTRDGAGSNIKCILSTDADSNNLRTLSGNYYAGTFYSNLVSTHTTVNRIAGINALADVGNTLTGTTVTNLTSVLARGVAARNTTVVTNAHAVYAESPKHGVNRYAGYFEEPTGGSGENFSIKALGDCSFQKSISINGRKITYSATEPVNPNGLDVWHELSTEATGSLARIKQTWFRTNDSSPSLRRWVSADIYSQVINIFNGNLSTNYSVPFWLSSDYQVCFQRVQIQAFIGSGSLSATDSWTTWLLNRYVFTVAAEVLFQTTFNGGDDGLNTGNSVRKTLIENYSNFSPIVNADPVNNKLWIVLNKNANAPALTEPTMFLEYRLVRP